MLGEERMKDRIARGCLKAYMGLQAQGETGLCAEASSLLPGGGGVLCAEALPLLEEGVEASAQSASLLPKVHPWLLHLLYTPPPYTLPGTPSTPAYSQHVSAGYVTAS